jgi:predicted component of type VI protein secretion system
MREIPVLNMRAQLVPLDGGSPIDIARDLTLVGRKEDCDLRLDHKSVSKLHCVIVKTDGLLLVRDLGSTNGTRVNGQRIRRAALLPNDKLTIANFHFRILFGAAAAEPPPSPEEHTMHMEAKDVAQLMNKSNKAGDPLGDSSLDMQIMEIQANALPDVYPEEDGKR